MDISAGDDDGGVIADSVGSGDDGGGGTEPTLDSDNGQDWEWFKNDKGKRKKRCWHCKEYTMYQLTNFDEHLKKCRVKTGLTLLEKTKDGKVVCAKCGKHETICSENLTCMKKHWACCEGINIQENVKVHKESFGDTKEEVCESFEIRDDSFEDTKEYLPVENTIENVFDETSDEDIDYGSRYFS